MQAKSVLRILKIKYYLISKRIAAKHPRLYTVLLFYGTGAVGYFILFPSLVVLTKFGEVAYDDSAFISVLISSPVKLYVQKKYLFYNNTSHKAWIRYPLFILLCGGLAITDKQLIHYLVEAYDLHYLVAQVAISIVLAYPVYKISKIILSK